MTTNRLTANIELDYNCLDVRNAAMYSGIGAMQLRKYIRAGVLPGSLRAPVDNPTGHLKYWISIDDLEVFVAARKARKISRGISVRFRGRICYKAQRIKGVISMLRKSEVAQALPASSSTTIALLTDLVAELMSEHIERVAKEISDEQA